MEFIEESVFAPFFNRHLIKIADCHSPDALIYGSRSNIVVLKWSDNGASIKIIDCAHLDWVSGIVSAPANAPEHLARTFISCGKDGNVKLWNIDSLNIIKAHKTHNTKYKQDVTVNVIAVCWSHVNPNLVTSAGENGCLVVWHLTENLTTKYSHKQLRGVKILASSPNDENVVAAGCGGVIFLIKFYRDNLRILSRFRVFPQDLHDIAWQPTSENPVLAATSKVGELSWWDCEKEKCIKTVKLEGNGFKYQNNEPPLYPLLWSDKDTLLSRSGNSLISINFNSCMNSPQSDGIRKQWKVVQTPHARDFQALIHSRSDSGRVWTLGSDRKLSECELKSGELKRSVGLVNGDHVCWAVSPHDPHVVAMGGYDATIRIWNVSRHTGTCTINNRNVLDKIMSLCWHHTKENILLFATRAGRIGVVDIREAKQPHLLPHSSSKSVYWMCWGPPPPSSELDHSHLFLYVVTNLKLYAYQDIYSTSEPLDLTQVLSLPSSGVTDASWKPDMSLLAVGCKDGTICIFKPKATTPDLTISAPDAVQYLAWHPEMTSSETELSIHRNLLTCGSVHKSGVITVYAVKTGDTVTASVQATLSGHDDHVQTVSWSPHVSGHLVTSSADNTVRVWNVLTATSLLVQEPMENVRNWYAFWNPVHSDYIITGCGGGVLINWKISNKSSIECGEKKKKFKIIKKKYVGVMAEVKDLSGEAVKSKPKEKESGLIAQRVSVVQNIQPMAAPLDKGWARPKLDNEFLVCETLLKTPPNERAHIYSLAFFGTPENVQNKMTEILVDVAQDEKWTSGMMWQGKVKEVVEKKMEEGGLTDQLVALSASVSPRLWQQASLVYAQQLLVANNFIAAATYMVAARRIELAIQVLIEGKLFTDALCLARCQLPEDDPAVGNISKAYSQHLIATGNFAKAAECLIFMERYEDAAQCLSQCADPVALCAAALAARHTTDKKLQEKLALAAFAYHVVYSKSGQTNFDKIHYDHESVKLLGTVMEFLRTSQPAVSLLDSYKDSIQDNLDCYQKIAAISPVTILPNITHHNIQEWTKIQQLALAVSGPNDRTKSQHLLQALHAAQLQGAADLCLLCQQLSPGLLVEGLFSTSSGLGTSLRAFLCLALIHKAGINSEESAKMLPRINALKEDLLNEKAFVYYRTKSLLSLREKQVSKLIVSVSAPNDKTHTQAVDSLTEDLSHLSCQNIEDKNVSPSSQHKKPPQINDEVFASSQDDKSLNVSETSPNNDPKSIRNMVEERNQLVLTISRIEAERGLIPNPVIGLSLLRNYFLEHSETCEDAKESLAVILSKYLPLSQ